MSKHVTVSPAEVADRLSVRELIEAYAHCADRRDAEGQMALFTEETHFVVYMNANDPKPSQELHSRAALGPVFADLNKYAATQHLVGKSTILALTADRATGEAYTMAHHLTVNGEKRNLMVAALRYHDTFVKENGPGCSLSANSTSTGSSNGCSHDWSSMNAAAEGPKRLVIRRRYENGNGGVGSDVGEHLTHVPRRSTRPPPSV
jgi:SnoaL-like domain